MTIIIAEAGVNHNGDLKTAFDLVDAAVNAKADIIKFQSFKAEKLATFNADKAIYQKRETNPIESQQSMLKRLELNFDEQIQLKNYCDSRNIEFLSTPFDTESIKFLTNLNPKRWKIPSGEITNIPYLKIIGSQKIPIILSTGMSNMSEIALALETIQLSGTPKNMITVLQCTTCYPAPIDQINLNAMKTISEAFDVNVGYSDHTCDLFIPVAAVAMGAKIIEKHFTLDRTMEGPDHKASLEPHELVEMIQAIKKVEKSLGDGNKRPLASEIENIKVARKSIVASIKIKKGDIFSEENLTTKRPGIGISPIHWEKILGMEATRNYDYDELINW